MKKSFKQRIAFLTLCLLTITTFIGSSYQIKHTSAVANTKDISQSIKAPKYIFLFIGDGMSYPQIQASSDYLGALTQPQNTSLLTGPKLLNFMNFPVVGSAITYDLSSFCPDSASTGTSIASGHKTLSSIINMDETKTKTYETIAEKLKHQLGYKIGIVSSANINHATPAAFYAHQPSRNNYYEIGKELIASNFDYIAGGEFKNPTGNEKENTQPDLYSLATKAGYGLVTTQNEASKLTKTSGKSIVIGETLADSGSLSYDLDASETEWRLKDYVKKGIEVLDNKTGFFMMVEGGKIDWACHANDAASAIADTIALSKSVDEALTFYNSHPDETLILVTADHETGGLTIGYAGTNYDTYLSNLSNQKLSYAKFDSDFVSTYKKNKTPFIHVLKDMNENFGLVTKKQMTATTNPNLVLTENEYSKLEAAYNKTIGTTQPSDKKEDYLLYGTYEPFTITITHILDNKCGLNFSTYSHTGLPVPVFAKGCKSELFDSYYDNTDIYHKLASLLNLR